MKKKINKITKKKKEKKKKKKKKTKKMTTEVPNKDKARENKNGSTLNIFSLFF